ncbi:MAG: DNA polymerase IV [Oscillospiraceae bacterium]|nr:DNA polymerase IV [Oscillospiraceae bacterium]
MYRTILHCDMNSFFASVELLSFPELCSRPVAVCGDPMARHGIILAKNEPAKKYGIKTAETIWQAKKKCPDLVLLPPHHEKYREYSVEINKIYERYTDLVEPFSIDESWLDVTGTIHLFGNGEHIADEIRAALRKELGLTASVGVSFNKIFAKLGSDYKKPDATTIISPENWRGIVFPLPVSSLLFVGKNSSDVLHKYGIDTIGQLAACKKELLTDMFGKPGIRLYEYSNGLENSPVLRFDEREDIKSVGNGTTFPRDLVTRDEIKTGIAILSDMVAVRLRRHGLYATGIQVTIRDPSFKTITRQKQLQRGTHLAVEIMDASMEIIDNSWKISNPIRMLTVTALSPVSADELSEQLDLLSEQSGKSREKAESIEKAMDGIRGRFGRGAIAYGAAVKDDLITEPDIAKNKK